LLPAGTCWPRIGDVIFTPIVLGGVVDDTVFCGCSNSALRFTCIKEEETHVTTIRRIVTAISIFELKVFRTENCVTNHL